MTFSFEPRWVPTEFDGTGWALLSYKGRLLGEVSRDVSADHGGSKLYCAKRVCCDLQQWTGTIRQARFFVEQTLECSYCAQKVTSAALRAYGKPI